MSKNICQILFLSILLFLSCKDEVIEPDPLLFSFNVKHVSVYGENDGRIELTVTGGIPPYKYEWSNGDSTNVIDSLIAASYIVTVSDKNQLTRSDTIEITQPDPYPDPEPDPDPDPDPEPDPDPLSLILTGEDVSIYGGSDGAAHAEVSGGLEPYVFEWSNGCTDASIYELEAGVYYVAVSDAQNETISDSIIISQPEENQVIISVEYTNPSETGATDGSILISVSGGYPPYSVSWSEDFSGYELNGLGAGIYTVVVTDNMGQQAEEAILLTDVLTDIDGNTYTIVQIGEQTWIGENLRVNSAPDGTPIESYVYMNDESYAEQYGRLYKWDVAMNNFVEENSQGICPSGWHIPSDEDYKVLEMFLGMTRSDADLVNRWRGMGVGTSLKAGGESGYNAQLSGRVSSTGRFELLGNMEFVWTSTEYGSNAWRRCLDINSPLSGRWNTFPKLYGMSVRCIKD
jgi:uncharacterized protein (TIGR02145 family)